MLYFIFVLDVWEGYPYVLKLVTNMGTEGRYRSIVGNVSAVSIMPWPYCPYPWAEVLISMLYFLFVLDGWEAFPNGLKLVTNMGTEGTSRYRSIDAIMTISLGMCLPYVMCHGPIVHIPEPKCWYRCYISYSYWIVYKHFRMYCYCSHCEGPDWLLSRLDNLLNRYWWWLLYPIPLAAIGYIL